MCVCCVNNIKRLEFVQVENSSFFPENRCPLCSPICHFYNSPPEGWKTDPVLLLRNHAGFSWSYQNCLGLSLDFLGPIGFVAATCQLIGRSLRSVLVKRDLNPAKTTL